MHTELQSRARGSLLGLACGNLLGLPNEFARSPRVPPVTEIDPAELQRDWDDDLAQAVELCEALLCPGGFEASDFAARLSRWARTNGRGIGLQTRDVLAAYGSGLTPFEAAHSVWERSGRRAAGNGGVMRIAPVGLRCSDEPESLARIAWEATAVTHWDPRCTQSAFAVASAVAALLHGENALEAALQASSSLSEPDAELLDRLAACPRFELEDLGLRAEPGSGYTLTCAAVGLWAVEQAEDAPSTLLAVVNAGGDTDTNGAVAGALLGARHGVAAWPERWLARIPGRARLEGLADALVARPAASALRSRTSSRGLAR
jgi:ADP-ribosyl-[dinitrogen reductase] hydrolase